MRCYILALATILLSSGNFFVQSLILICPPGSSPKTCPGPPPGPEKKCLCCLDHHEGYVGGRICD
ncbi:hypothetical protein PGT21_008351 [Puccinia graminis f. sp. tritici]|uniref:Uncharacterized protein n=1 Tax=Puccinia graminis f. sp. tritici TaxID=56615 RepID=A0A5B0MCL2_PUCGR|nr:hypothetical protein PGTUg99_027987 [Puccinia graminis f. sp. tritici]KAA1116297.1 hypothetical protein PGT21_008351 [Puccinia graminis f. sp. tritici]